MKKIIPVLLLVFIGHYGFSQHFAKQSFVKKSGYPSGSYQSLTFNGSWCWFSDPRAVYYEGRHKRTYCGWVDNFGDIQIGFYDHETHEIHSSVLYDNLQADDHDNPSILFDEQGRLLIFFNRHGGSSLYLVRSAEPEEITTWGPVKQLHLNDPEVLKKMNCADEYTYTCPVMLSAEHGRIYLFWRGADSKPTYSYSDDDGETWTAGKIFFMPERIYNGRRPYVKIYSDGVDKIHFTLTDGHPRDEQKNNIYYMYYKGGSFYKASGEKIKDAKDLPVKPEEADLVYDASRGNARAWNWDVAQDKDGNPVIAYAKFPNDSTHIYSYAAWDGKKWNNDDLVNSGRWFQQTRKGTKESEPNYSGGMGIDHESPNILYLSVNRDSVFEMEKWETTNQGKSWKVEKITSGSSNDNVRPFAVRNAKEGSPLQVLWMQNSRYRHYANKANAQNFADRFQSSIKMNILSPEIQNPLAGKSILDIMHQTADWQLAHPRYDIDPRDWHYGAFYIGLRALYEITGENRYKNELVNIGQWYNWQPMDEILHADKLSIVDTWTWLYEQEKNVHMIEKAKWALDINMARNYKEETNVRFANNPYYGEWWSWCDALFMAPPAFVRMAKVTGDERYLKYMDGQWWKSSDYLYSKEDSLYYRDDRFFDQRSDNHKKIFWARGNGWVIAGLARILTIMPADYPNRKAFEQQFKEMAYKLLSIQSNDGLWRVSLLDPEYLNIGESSGSSFFTFALAWGINHGLVDTKYRPNVEKAWIALCKNVSREGRLGYVQQVAGSPYPFHQDEWHVYATGAFLMAGKEMLALENDTLR